MTAITLSRATSSLHPQQRSLLLLNMAGGAAVLASYWYGLAGSPDAGDALWGGVPAWMRPLYTISMLTAATGYFPFTLLLCFGVDPECVRVGRRLDFRVFHALYALILIPSALWMPLTFGMLESGTPALWPAIVLVLATVGLASLGLLAALLRLSPRPSPRVFAMAVAGAVAFCVQTALLDATVWTAYFPVPLAAGAVL